MARVLIAGGGPTGLMLAAELRLAGVEVRVLDRLPGRTGESRAGGLHPRTLEVLDQRGALEPFLATGTARQLAHFSALPLDFSGLATRHPHSLLILQAEVERLLEDRLAGLGVRVRWSAEIVGLRQDANGVVAEVRGPDGTELLAADYLVGCDGGRSTVRRLAGIVFPGTPATLSSLIGDVELSEPPAEWIAEERREQGRFSVFGFRPGWYRVTVTEYDRVTDRGAPAGLAELREAALRVAGTDFGMHSPRWTSRFNDAARQAAAYRAGRVLLAGDAAHIHFPAGGQGLNLGVQDAVNLGWKLALVARGLAPERLLDTYQAERHPVARRVLDNTRAQTALGRPGPHTTALREVLAGLLADEAPMSRLSGMISALDIRYPLGEGHPLLGRRMPDLDLTTERGATRVYALLHEARPVLLLLGADHAPGANPAPGGAPTPGVDPAPGEAPAPGGDSAPARAARGWGDRVRLVRARCPRERVEVPGAGEVALPTALLIRPDGHVAWTDAAPATGLPEALTTWCGPSGVRV